MNISLSLASYIKGSVKQDRSETCFKDSAIGSERGRKFLIKQRKIIIYKCGEKDIGAVITRRCSVKYYFRTKNESISPLTQAN